MAEERMVEDFAGTLRAAAAGEEWAIGRLWRALQPRLLRYLSVRVGQAAEDVASEAWIRVARNLGSFEGGQEEFCAWFFTIARRALIDWQRRACRRPATTVLHDEDVVTGGDDPAVETVERLGLDHVLELVRRLPEDQADVILLRVVAGLDTERVAAIVGRSPGAIRVMQHRGLRRLAELLAATTTTELAAS
jgi:RNA polymerase sigma-70 factor (ECF subfamily)